jgi:hypothetical protein
MLNFVKRQKEEIQEKGTPKELDKVIQEIDEQQKKGSKFAAFFVFYFGRFLRICF